MDGRGYMGVVLWEEWGEEVEEEGVKRPFLWLFERVCTEEEKLLESWRRGDDVAEVVGGELGEEEGVGGKMG